MALKAAKLAAPKVAKAAKLAAPKVAKAVAAQWQAKVAPHRRPGLDLAGQGAAARLPKAELQREPRALPDKPVLPLPAPAAA